MISSSQSSNKEPSLAIEDQRAAGSTFFRTANLYGLHKWMIRNGRPRQE